LKTATRCYEKVLAEFDRLPLSVRFILAFALPVASILWMSVSNAFELYQRAHLIEQLQTHTVLATESGQLAGYLQDERGISLIAQKGLKGQLGTARASTDVQLAKVEALLESVVAKSLGDSGFVINLAAITKSLTSLPVVRGRIDRREANTNDIQDYFTGYVEAFNTQISQLSRQSLYSDISRKLEGYYVLNQLREMLGQERATLSQALINNSLTDRQFRTLVALSGKQAYSQSAFKALVSDASTTYRLSPASSATLYRDQLLNAVDQAPLLQALSVEEWFSLQSERIGQIRVLEKKLEKDIYHTAGNLLESARRELWRYLIITPLVLLTALTVALLVFRHMQARLRLIEIVFKHTNDRITVTDGQANIVAVNDAFTRITGFSSADALGKNPRILRSGRQDHNFYKNLWSELKKTGAWQGELWNRRKDGAVFAELTTINAVRDRHGATRYYVAVSSEITDRAFEHQRQLEYRAYHDLLTGLPNQTLLRDRLEHALNISKRSDRHIIVACVDLDYFKEVNDRYGHTFGDELLELVASRLCTFLRDSDSVARTGGDEFLIVLEETDTVSNGPSLLQRVLQELCGEYTLSGISLSLTVSIGASCSGPNAGDADTLIRYATHALHESKQNGRGKISWFDPEKAQSQELLSKLIKQLEKALSDNELRLFYQPKVNMVTGELLGAEALLRWQDPSRGLVPPGQFLPQIEQHPFSILIGNWVVGTALSQISEWRGAGFSPNVSLNINALQLLDTEFVPSLRTHLQKYPDLPPDCIELEVLESAALNDIEHAGEVLKECRNLGIKVSLDDFGTGYAALEYLKRLPADSLKIDQTFTRDMLDNPGDMAIVKGIVGLSEAFGFSVIAEGVETEEQGSALIAIGCTDAQGYGIARPMPADQFLEWKQRWKPYKSWQAQ